MVGWERAVTGFVALLAAAAGFAVARFGLGGGPEAWLTVALIGLGAAYFVLTGLLAWHVCSGVALEGYLSGEHDWAIVTRTWLGRILMFPLLLVVPATELYVRGGVSRSIRTGLSLDEKIRRVMSEVVGDGLWAFSDRSLYVGSLRDGAFRRIPFGNIHSVAAAPRGPWARTELVLTFAGHGEGRQVHGTFTHKGARLAQARLATRGVPKAQR